jgi:hypothetical protein
MSTYEHDLLTARFAALAPRPPPGDWDDVLDRAGALSRRRRRFARSLWRGGRRRKLVVALAVAVLVAAVAAAAYGTVRVLFLDKGFIGLPPVGATPSATESADLVLHWEGFTATLPPQRQAKDFVRVWVYADGRIIWDRRPHSPGPERGIPEGANELNSGYLEQRVTPGGLEAVRSAVAGLFDRSRTLLETFPTDDPWPSSASESRLALFVPGGSEVPDVDPSWGVVEVRDGNRVVRLHWRGLDIKDTFEGTIATPEQLSALRRVDALLTDPVGAAAERVGRAEGQGVRGEVADALSGPEPEPGWRRLGLAYRVAEPVNNLNPTRIWFEPYFPHGQFTFSGPFG